jgi:hypothetical protein
MNIIWKIHKPPVGPASYRLYINGMRVGSVSLNFSGGGYTSTCNLPDQDGSPVVKGLCHNHYNTKELDVAKAIVEKAVSDWFNIVTK